MIFDSLRIICYPKINILFAKLAVRNMGSVDKNHIIMQIEMGIL